MPENIKQTFIFDVRFLHREQNGGKFESKHQFTIRSKSETKYV